MNTITDTLRSAFAPTGRLRASINLGNPILAHRNADTGEVGGVSVDMARLLAQRLGLPMDLVVFDAAGKSVEAVMAEEADFGFFAVDPVRGQGIAFTAPYVLIEGSYMVRTASPLHANRDVDRAGIRVVVGKGSAYDLYLTRELKAAAIERAPTSPTVIDVFVQTQADVAAGVRQQLESDLSRFPGHRILPGHFMVIQQAMGCPKVRPAEVAAYLASFVEEMKASGFVAEALRRHCIEGAAVAPAVKA
ncbi:ABC transporter substrate-binding protein [Acidovorax sp. Leaf78]|uniref:ABC transporter substrate-binding protein n=1 Tax=Acidovorax sp. Leaf78 TaxID=1736237 RepID=UPI0006FF14B1|nr:ABC transporter substrate-binding protein [Acidovorax sp. Leaf78]KQO19090.1 ABC transporter substrate-binding protein [Acidovorax sp. Leaf78]